MKILAEVIASVGVLSLMIGMSAACACAAVMAFLELRRLFVYVNKQTDRLNELAKRLNEFTGSPDDDPEPVENDTADGVVEIKARRKAA